VTRLELFDPDYPCDFHVRFDSLDGPLDSHFTVDTEESAAVWRRAFEGALFQHARTKHRERMALQGEEWGMLRVCIPLDRVTLEGISDYHSFATLAALVITLADRQTLDPELRVTAPPREHEGRARPMLNTSSNPVKRSFSIKGFGKATRGGEESPDRASSPLKKETKQWLDTTADPMSDFTTLDHIMSLNVAILNEQAWFVKALEAAIQSSQGRQWKQGTARPKMIMVIGDHDCLSGDDDDVRGPSTSSDERFDEEEREESGHLAETKKAEKASMAAKVFGLREEEGIYRELYTLT
jgi:sterol 3beta-glucosyltransferase